MDSGTKEGGAPAAGTRKIVNYKTADYIPYGLQGETQEDITWCNLSYDESKGEGFFLVKFAPNSRSIPHKHVGYEEFVVLEGEIVDSDGTVFRAGDCVSQPPGSSHYSTSRDGAVAVVSVRGGFENYGRPVGS